MDKIKPILNILKLGRKDVLIRILLRFNFLFSDEIYIRLLYYLSIGRKLNLRNPITFTEKIQWLKLYDRKPEYTKMVDKYAVKEYVSNIIGREYIIPTLGVWNSVNEIEWDKLPPQFVLKTTHGGGGSGVVIVKNKTTVKIDDIKKKLNKSLKQDIYKYNREWPYKNVPKRIIAEKFMAPEKSPAPKDLPDYKFFCFNGVPKYCQVIRDRHTKETIDFYDMDWIHQEFVGLLPPSNTADAISNGLTPVARPKNLDEMKDICRKLANGIPFVRVDLYVIDDKKYFGEITFYPASGIGVFTPEEWNGKLGDLLTLPNATGGVNM